MEKKPVISLTDGLSEAGVFFLTTNINYNDKTVLYERGVVRTENIDGEEFTGKEPESPYQIVEIDKKTGKRKIYKVVLEYEDELGPHHTLAEEELNVGPFTFERLSTWNKKGESSLFLKRYSFVKTLI